MKCVVLDIETTALEAVGSGMIVCAVLKPLREKPIVLRYDELRDTPGKEKKLVRAINDGLENFHMVIGHNVDGFDWTMLKSRAVILGVKPARSMLSYDTMKAFGRTGFRTSMNHIGKPTKALDHIADFLGIKQLKTKIYPREHWKTVWEEGADRKRAIDALVDHCVRDCEMTEKIYWRLMEVDTVDRIKRLK